MNGHDQNGHNELFAIRCLFKPVSVLDVRQPDFGR